ncbi:MAG: hypothetical protein GX303_04145 [Clostridiales bacterium]|nr:hypothetical protein [Clostridiales bacterium]
MKNIGVLIPLLNSLKELFSPYLIILFGAKYEEENKIVDIDICIVTDILSNKKEMLRKAYLKTDCDIPYDIFIYSPQEWDEMKKDSGSFVSRIIRKGYVWYEQEA